MMTCGLAPTNSFYLFLSVKFTEIPAFLTLENEPKATRLFTLMSDGDIIQAIFVKFSFYITNHMKGIELICELIIS